MLSGRGEGWNVIGPKAFFFIQFFYVHFQTLVVGNTIILSHSPIMSQCIAEKVVTACTLIDSKLYGTVEQNRTSCSGAVAYGPKHWLKGYEPYSSRLWSSSTA